MLPNKDGVMNKSIIRLAYAIPLLVSACLLTGCGGTKVLKEPEPMQITQALGAVSDQQVTATLDWVIVRDGPGSWAKNADWDEYLLSVNNQSDQPISVTSITVIDSLDAQIEPQAGRKKLVKSSKETARRYKKSGVKVKAGRGAGTMLVAGAAVTAVGVGAAAATTYGAAMGAAAGSAGAAAGGLLLLGPALAVGGIARGVNNSKVNTQIELRQTTLPIEIPASGDVNLDVFFPLAPSPKRVELTYTDANGENTLVIDTSVALNGLHMGANTE